MADRSGTLAAHIGARLRKLRSTLGMSQEQLGKALGLTFQQVQKYESGANRIAAERLYEVAGILNVPVGYFFEDHEGAVPAAAKGFAENEHEPFGAPAMSDVEHREMLKFARLYQQIRNPKMRKSVLDLMQSMADNQEETKAS